MATVANTRTDFTFPAQPGIFTRLFQSLVTWNAARQTRDELMKLNDRELDDIGLNRGDIDAVADRIWRG